MTAVGESVSKLFLRDLSKLEAELRQYSSEELIWKVEKGISNCAGNLCLHLCGNIQHYIGAVLGNSGYVRNRDNEFAVKDIPLSSLIAEIAAAKKAVETTLPLLTEEQLQSDYPQKVFDYPMTTSFFLIHLTAHLGYHLGQVNYHRRLVR